MTITMTSRATLGLCLVLMLSGCGTMHTVLGGCELPPELATKSVPMDPVLPGLSLEDQHKQWSRDRGYGAKAAKHGDDTIDYVAAHCQ